MKRARTKNTRGIFFSSARERERERERKNPHARAHQTSPHTEREKEREGERKRNPERVSRGKEEMMRGNYPLAVRSIRVLLL
jgi:hypothetical protein